MLPAGPKVTNDRPTPLLAPSLTGKLETWFQVTPKSLLRHNPFLRVPRYSVLWSAGSITSFSPMDRPSSLLPSLNGRLVRSKVLPWSVERRIEPLPAHSLV